MNLILLITLETNEHEFWIITAASKLQILFVLAVCKRLTEGWNCLIILLL